MLVYRNLGNNYLFESQRLSLVFFTDHNNAIVWMGPTSFLMPKSSSYFQIFTEKTNFNWHRCHLHVPLLFFSSLARSRCFSLFSLSTIFTLSGWKSPQWVRFFGVVVDCQCYVLTFWPGQKCHSRWCTGRKWHILMAVMRGNRVGGNWMMK